VAASFYLWEVRGTRINELGMGDQLIIAKRLDFSGDINQLLANIVTVKKLISGLIKRYKS
jgi:hypothetical protein